MKNITLLPLVAGIYQGYTVDATAVLVGYAASAMLWWAWTLTVQMLDHS